MNLPSRFFADYDKLITKHPQFSIPESATFVGTGGFGAWAALFACLAGVPRIVLINIADTDESTGHNVQEREVAIGPFREADLGKAKVDALKEILLELRPSTQIDAHKAFFDPRDPASVKLLTGVVFSGVSEKDINRQIFCLASARGLRCFGGVYSGICAGIRSYLPADEEIGGTSIPVWVGSAVLSAVFAIQAACVRPFNYLGDLSELSLNDAEFDRRYAPSAARDSNSP